MVGALAYWLLLLVKGLLWLVELPLDLLFGYTFTKGSSEERRKAWLHHEYSAQVVNIRARAHYVDIIPSTLYNFLYTHEKYVSPKYILENKNVTLFSFDGDQVIFCETDEDVNIYNTNNYPFVFIHQFRLAKKLVILPMDSFHRLGDELGDPSVPVCLVNMTARCGSTLISQMVNRVPNVRSISEPMVLSQANNHFRKQWINYDQMRRLVQTCVRIQCKVEPGSNVERFVIKVTPSASPTTIVTAELFPQFKYIFNTRHPKPSSISLLKLMNSVREWNLFVMLKINLKEFAYNNFPFPYKENYLKMTENVFKILYKYSIEDLLSVVYAATFLTYWDCKDIYHQVILYENLVAEPEKEVKKFFKTIGISEDHVPGALEALKTDSQKGTFGKREEKPVISDQMWQRLDSITKSFVPELSSKMSVEEFKSLFR